MKRAGRATALFFPAVLLSGGAALVYEVVWSRQLSVFLGITLHAHAIVLAAFMAGLALGSRSLGALCDRTEPEERASYRLFASIEGGIAVYGLASALVFPKLSELYAGLAGAVGPAGTIGHGTRFLVAIVALGIPTFLMGGTLPVLVRARLLLSAKPAKSARSARSARSAKSVRSDDGLKPEADPAETGTNAVASIYAVNTLGAAGGALAAGFLLLPKLGTTGSLLVAAAANGAVALWAWTRSLAEASTVAKTTAVPGAAKTTHSPESVRADVGPAAGAQRLLVALAVFGGSALALQLAWTQALTHLVGASAYAMSLVLATYLAGLGLGSSGAGLVARLSGRAGGSKAIRIQTWAALLAAAAASAATLASLAVFERLPAFLVRSFRANPDFELVPILTAGLGAAAAMLALPTLLFGALTPLLLELYRKRQTAGALVRRPGTRPMTQLVAEPIVQPIGVALAANAAGTTLGALLGGFWLLPTFGLQRTILIGAAGLAVCAWLVVSSTQPSQRRSLALAAVLVGGWAIAAWALPAWSPAVATSGPFLNATRLLDGLPEDGTESGAAARAGFNRWLDERSSVVFYREGAIGSVAVRDVGEERLLVINGKTDGSRLGDRRTQLALGHLAALLSPDPESVLLVGLGTGMTAAAVAAHGRVARLDVVEISPEVVEASRYFGAENRGILLDGRLRLHAADARNYLLTSDRRWDVIISEPSNPWITGVANLFTREYFELAASRLAPDGLMAQWIQGYGMARRDLRSLLATFASVFDEVTVWCPQPGDLVVIGSSTPRMLDLERLEKAAITPAGVQDFHAGSWDGPDALLRTFLLPSADAREFANGAPINSDARPLIEFGAPRNLYRETTIPNLNDLLAQSSAEEVPVPIAPTDAFGLESSEVPLEARIHVRWRALAVANPTPLPYFGVSLRRVVRAGTGEGAQEIDVRTGDPEHVASRLDTLLGSAIATLRPDRLASGEEATTALDAGGTVLGTAWACAPASTERTRHTYAALGSDAAALALRSLRCSPAPSPRFGS